MKVGALDLGILVAYVVGVVLFGMWVGRGARSAADYMVGDRNLPWWLIMFSIIATETSTVTFLSIPGFSFERDLTWLQIPIGFLVGRCLVGALLLPQYFRGTFFTSYEILARRFGGGSQQVASVLFVITRSLADGLRLFLAAIVLQEMTGLPLQWAVVAMGVSTVLYTYFGGIRAVIWTDFIQFAIYIVGAIVAFVLLLRALPGGWGQLVSASAAAGKLRFLDLSPDWSEPYTLWAGIVGGIFITLGSHGIDQLMVQRYFCARSLGDARRALVVGGFIVLAQFALFLVIGLGLFAFYQQFPTEVPFDRADRVFVRFILEQMPVGTVGLLLGAIFAAAMSSSLNSCATAATHDLYRPWAGARATPERELRMTRWLTALFGAVQIGVGIGGQWVQASVVATVLGIAAFTTGLVLGVFLLGMFSPRVGQRAAMAGLLVGFAGMTAIFFATPLAWPWYALVGAALTSVAGVAASYLWPRELVPAG